MRETEILERLAVIETNQRRSEKKQDYLCNLLSCPEEGLIIKVDRLTQEAVDRKARHHIRSTAVWGASLGVVASIILSVIALFTKVA